MPDFFDLSDLEDILGPIQAQDELCPGVYLLSAQSDEEIFISDYFVVRENSIITQTAKSYGRKVSGLWLYSLADDTSGQWIIKYEVARYRLKNHLPLDEPFRATALFAAQSHPDYFGTFPVPIYTPRGCTVRYWVLDNGVYWIETDQCEKVLAVCYPIWSTELSDLAERLGEKTEYDNAHDIEITLGYIFFPGKMSCIPLYELMRTRSEWDKTLIDKPALMNAIWRILPEYALLMNQQEQAGQNDIISALLREIDMEVEPNISPNNMIMIFPDAGEEYFLFDRLDAKLSTN